MLYKNKMFRAEMTRVFGAAYFIRGKETVRLD